MFRFGNKSGKRRIDINVNVNHIVLSKLVETKNNAKYLIGYLDDIIRPLVLIFPKMSGYVKTFKVKDGDKVKNNKLLMSFSIDEEKPLEKYNTIWSNGKGLQNIKLSARAIYDDRYIETKIKTYVDKVYTNFHGLDVSKDDVECESFTITFIDSLLVNENKYYLQVYSFKHGAYKIVNT